MSNHRLVIVLFAIAVVATSFAVAQQQREGGDETLATLVEERQQTLQKLVDIARSSYKVGESSLDSLIVAERELLDAQLDSATTARERIGIRESQLRLATQQENEVAKLVENAVVSPKELMTAKVNRLNAQIALLRERQKLAGLAIAFSSGECAEPPVAVAQLKVDARMSGAWEVSPELNSLLGFEDDDVRSDLVDHPLSFNLTIDQTLTESLTKEAKATFAQFCDEIFRPMGHQVIATGQWQTKFRVEPGISTACYITQSRGKTHIWVKAPFVILYGGQVSFINGAIAKRDALVLNFNPERKERTPNIAAYRRSAK